ncbi:MAG: hypothetical protein GX547_16260 [Phycisphaerae bacterium]|nr:hypothetical protein [Phycisphaerae bacterium]
MADPYPAQIWRYAAANPNVQQGPLPDAYPWSNYGSYYGPGLPPVTGLHLDLTYREDLPPYWRTETGELSLVAEEPAAYPGRARWVWGTHDGITGWHHCLRFRWALEWIEWTGNTSALFRVKNDVHPLCIGHWGRLFFSRTNSYPGWRHKTPVRVIAVEDDEHERELIELTDVTVPSYHYWPLEISSSWQNRLTTRTSDTAGVITLPEDYGLEADDLIDLTWSGGYRKAVCIDSVDDTLITISGGFGDPLPAEGTNYIAIKRPGGTLYFALYAPYASTYTSLYGFSGPQQRGEIGAQLTDATRLDFEDDHGLTTADRLLIGSTHYAITAATDTTVTISPAKSGSVGVAVDCMPLCAALRADSAVRPNYRFPQPTIPEGDDPPAGQLVATDCQPIRCLSPTSRPALMWTGLETHTWGTWLDHYMLAVAVVPYYLHTHEAGDTIRLLVDYQDADNYFAAEYALIEHPDPEEDKLYFRLRLIDRTDGEETQLSRELYLWDRADSEHRQRDMFQFQVRLDPPLGDYGDNDAILGASVTLPTSSTELYTGAPVKLRGTRKLGLAAPSGDLQIRAIYGPTIGPHATLITRTSDTQGVWSLPPGCWPSREAEMEYAVGNRWYWAVGARTGINDLPFAGAPTAGYYNYSVLIEAIDLDARTLTGRLTSGPALPAVDTLGTPYLLEYYTNRYAPDRRTTSPTMHDIVFPARVDLSVSNWPLFAGDWGLLHNWDGSGPAQASYWACDDPAWDWIGWTSGEAPDDTLALDWAIRDCPAVVGKQTAWYSLTAGEITFPHANHGIRTGDLINIGTGLSGATATVSGAVVSFSGGDAHPGIYEGDLMTPYPVTIVTEHDDQAALITARIFNADAKALYGPHVTTTDNLVLAARLDPIDWRTGPMRADGPADHITFDRASICAPYKLLFAWDAATDPPITILDRTFPDYDTGEWTATIQFPPRAAGWTVPDGFFPNAPGVGFSCTFGPYHTFSGQITAYDHATNQTTWQGYSDYDGGYATLVSRVSDTVGTLDLAAAGATFHLMDVGLTVRIYGSGWSTFATVTARTDTTITFEADGLGDPLPPQGSTYINIQRRRSLPPPGGDYNEATGTTGWYVTTHHHFDPDFAIASELVPAVPL